MDRAVTITEHLEELRRRIFKSVIFVIIASCISYAFVEKIIANLARPAGRLVFIAPQEAFVANIMIAFFSGLFLSSPFLIYQGWKFIATALRPDEKRQTLVFIPLSFFFFAAGLAFGYLIIVPIGMNFLLGFATESVTPMITISKYVSFIGTLTLAFGVIFQLPLISLFLTKIGIITPRFLSKERRHAIVLIFIMAAILTPPDVVTQCLMAAPLLILYEIGIVFSKVAYRKAAK